MQIFGSNPDQNFLEYILDWVNQHNNGDAEALIFASSRSCLLVGTPKGPRKWVGFWNPQNQITRYNLNPSQWYDWNSLPKSHKSLFVSCFKQWRNHIDDTALRDVTPFFKRR